MHPKTEKFLKGVLIGIIGMVLVTWIVALSMPLYPLQDGSSERATCFMSIRNIQTGARSFAQLPPEKAPAEDPVDLNEVYGFMGISTEVCPAGGTYSVRGKYGDPAGTVFLQCSNPDHAPTPEQSVNW